MDSNVLAVTQMAQLEMAQLNHLREVEQITEETFKELKLALYSNIGFLLREVCKADGGEGSQCQ